MYNKDCKMAHFPLQVRALNIYYPKKYMHNVRRMFAKITVSLNFKSNHSPYI